MFFVPSLPAPLRKVSLPAPSTCVGPPSRVVPRAAVATRPRLPAPQRQKFAGSPSEQNAGLSAFAREIRRYSLLSAEEERDLAAQIQTVQALSGARDALGEKLGREPTLVEWADGLDLNVDKLSKVLDAGAAAKETLVNANLRLVVHIAKRVHRSRKDTGMPLLDLIQEGALSLIRAAELYDPDRGYRFASYAWASVLSGVRRAANMPSGSVVSVPERLRLAVNKLRAFRAKTLQETGSMPSREEEASLVPKVSLELVRDAAPHLMSTLLLDAPIRETDQLTVMDMIESSGDRPEEVVQYYIMKTKIRDALSKHLSPRSADILSSKFGLAGDPPAKLKDIADKYGISAPRVRQIILDGLTKIRRLEPGLASFVRSE
jgi:RNA polymerase sigma factor (sigma-70 family)